MASAPLRARKRNRLPASSFAYPKQRKYPIDTLGRARNALARSAQPQTFGTYGHVARAVRKKWGNKIASVGTKKGTVTRAGTRKGGKRPAYRKKSSVTRRRRK